MNIPRLDCKVHSSYDWHPTIDNKVEVSLIQTPPPLVGREGYYYYRVCVWGGDDCGVEKDFFSKDDYKKALTLYETLTKAKDLSISMCLELGMNPA